MGMENMHNGAFSVGDLFYTHCEDSMVVTVLLLSVQLLWVSGLLMVYVSNCYCTIWVDPFQRRDECEVLIHPHK